MLFCLLLTLGSFAEGDSWEGEYGRRGRFNLGNVLRGALGGFLGGSAPESAAARRARWTVVRPSGWRSLGEMLSGGGGGFLPQPLPWAKELSGARRNE
jgi:hypothetical protein